MARKTTGLSEADLRRVVAGVMEQLRRSADEQGDPPWMVGCLPPPQKMDCASAEGMTMYEAIANLDLILDALNFLRESVVRYVPSTVAYKSACPRPPKRVLKGGKKAAGRSPKTTGGRGSAGR